MPKRSRSIQNRLTRLRRLHKPALASLSVRPTEQGATERHSSQTPLPPRRRRLRIAWVLTPLILIALLFCAFRLVVLPRVAFNLENTVRAQIIPELQRRIGAPLEIGRIESDYVSSVTLHDIVIGRGAKSPIGALMRVPKVRLELDLVALTLRQTDAKTALRRVLVESPQLYIERDARGTLNWTRVWKSQPNQATMRTSALFQVRNGRVWLRDATLRSRDRNSLLARFDKLNLNAQTNGNDATTFDLRAPLNAIGTKSFYPNAAGALYSLQDVSTTGQLAADASWVTGNVRVPSVPAALAIEYSNGTHGGLLGRPIAASGKFATRLKYAWTRPTGNANLFQNLLLNGVARAQKIGLTFSRNWPHTSQRAIVRDLDGLIEINGRALQTRQVSLNVLNTPLVLNGAVTLHSNRLELAALDVTARSSRIDAPRLWSVFAPSLRVRNAALRDVSLRSGIVNGAVRIKGNATEPQITGEVSVATLDLQNRDSRLRTGSLRVVAQTTLSGARNISNAGISGQVTTSNLDLQHRDSQLQASSLRLIAQVVRNAKRNTPSQMTGEATLVNFKARNAGGRLQTSFLRLIGQTDLAALGGTVRFSARDANGDIVDSARATSDNRVLVRASAVDGAASWKRDARSLQLLNVSLNAPQYNVAANSINLSGRDLMTRLGWRADNSQSLWVANWQTRAVAGRSSRADLNGDLRSAILRGQFAAAGEGFNLPTKGTLRFVANDARLQTTRWGSGRFAGARGAVSWNKVGNVWPLQTDIALQRFSAQIGSTLQAKFFPTSTRNASRALSANSLRVFAATTDANARRPVWNGAATFDELNANSLRDLALSPQLAARVQNIGTVSGRARFFNIGGSAPVGSGDFRVSRATLDGYRLTNLRGSVALDGDNVTLRNASARSESGTLVLDADYNLKSGMSSLGLNVPNVTVGAERINPFLRALNLRFEGVARGTLRVSTGAISTRINSVSSFRVSFNLTAPQAALTSLPRGDVRVLSRDSIQMRDVRLSGEGVARRGADGRWIVDGRSQIVASRAQLAGSARALQREFRVGNWTAPAGARGAQMSRLMLMAQGRVNLRGAERRIAAVPVVGPARSTTSIVLPTNVTTGRAIGTLRADEIVLPLHSPMRNDIVLRAVSAPFSWNGEQVQVPNFAAQLPQLQRIEYSNGRQVSRSATVDGNINYVNGQWRGQVLARELDASRVQRLADAFWRANKTNSAPLFGDAAVRGAAFVRADFNGSASDTRLNLQARLYNGALAVPPQNTRSSTRAAISQATPRIVRVEAAVLRASYQTGSGAIGLHELTVWSGGARLTATGNVAAATVIATTSPRAVRSGSGALPLDFDVQLNNVRVRDLQAVAQVRLPQGFDGVLSGAWRLSGTTQAPRAEGRAALRLARIADVPIDEATAQVRWENSATGTRLALDEIVLRSDQTSVQGAAIADTRRNLWRANLTLERAPAAQLLRAARALSANVVTRGNQNVSWPLRGSVRAVVAVNGNFTNRNLLSPQAESGSVAMNADTLRWRGRELGAMTANLNLRDNVLYIEDAALVRQLSVAEVALLRGRNPILTPPGSTSSTRGTAASNRDAAETANDSSVAQESRLPEAPGTLQQPPLEVGDVAVVRVSGEIPLARNANVKVGVRVENERYTVLRDLLFEVQRTLNENGQDMPLLQRAVSSTRTLPSGLEGRVNASAQLTGTLPELQVALDANVDNARLNTQDLPSLETSLVFNGGAIEVNALEVRQDFLEDSNGKSQNVRETALRIAPGGRIVPGGEISLDVDVLKANLSQLATWIPALRTREGAPALNGELSLFTFEVRGQTASPEVQGSVEARDVSFNGTTLDRLRVTTFQIKDDVLSIAPGNFTVVKGGFQSSAAYGSVPWSWGGSDKPIGPRRDGALEVHLPLQTRDFGALSGAFVPALTNVTADEFLGSVDITGSIDAPRIAGEMRFANARFRVDPAVGPFPFGIDKMNGSLRFVDGNRVLVEKLNGQFERAQDVRATSTGNAPASQRSPQAALRELRSQIRGATPPDLAGNFTLDGSVELDLDPRNAATADMRLASHHYDLSMTLQNGAIYSATYSGLRNINASAAWKTGEGEPQRAQNITWKISAQGRESLSRKLAREAKGTLTSKGSLQLATNFATNPDALLRSRFNGDLNLKDFAWQMRDVGRGIVNGDLRLDNGTSARPRTQPENTERIRSASTRKAVEPGANTSGANTSGANASSANTMQTRSSAQISEKNAVPKTPQPSSTRLANGTTFMTMPRRSFAQIIENPRATVARDDVPYENNVNDDAVSNIIGAATAMQSAESAEQNSNEPPLRITGDITMSQMEITGLPSGEGQGLTTLLDAPFLDISLRLGRDVRFTTSTIRAELGGELDLSGTPRAPRLVGVVSTRSGQVRFPTATARIEEGEISIDVSRDPVTQLLRSRATIDATARGQVGRYQITIVLRGPLDLGQNGANSNEAQNLRVDVTSNPPLSQDEAFAQLTGTSVRETDGQTNQAYASAVVNLLSAPLFAGLERSLEEAFGLNSLTLDYRLNEPIGIQLGKALNDRVFITYRRSLSRGNATQPAYDISVDFRVKGGVQVGVRADELGRKQVTIEKTIRF